MIQQLERKVTGNVLPEPKIISTEQLIDKLSQICEERFHAISAYPYANGAKEKLLAISEIRFELRAIRAMKNSSEITRACLRLEYRFLFLAPKATLKLFENYYSKVGGLMNSCREYLNWRKQQ